MLTKEEIDESTIEGIYGNAKVHLRIDHKGRMFFMSTPIDRSSAPEIVIFPTEMVERVLELCEHWLQTPSGKNYLFYKNEGIKERE